MMHGILKCIRCDSVVAQCRCFEHNKVSFTNLPCTKCETVKTSNMSKLPDELCKLRDEGGRDYCDWMKEEPRYQRYIKDGYLDGFDDGAEAMRTYMQAEVDKLETGIEQAIDWITPNNSPAMHGCFVHLQSIFASYRAWKDKK